MKGVLIALGVIVLVVLILGGSLMGYKNDLVREQEAYKAQWQQVDVDLQRRLDLIPNLVATVKGFAKQELAVTDSVTQARAAMMGAKTPADRIAASNQLEGALGRLFVIVENYPNLKSDENFLRLQDELAGTENRIAIARQRYNESLQVYNVDVQQFPKNIAASIFGFHRDNAYFGAEANAKEAPKVTF
jgi:LemA protein